MSALGQRLTALFRQRCPRCLQGRVYASLLAMHEHCPVCGHRFEREPGYFLGALYASYFLSIPLLGLLVAVLYWGIFPTWPAEVVVLLAVLPYLLIMPVVVRYSRVIWMHIDPPS